MHREGEELYVKGYVFSFLKYLLHRLMKFSAVRSVGVVKDYHPVFGLLVPHYKRIFIREGRDVYLVYPVMALLSIARPCLDIEDISRNHLLFRVVDVDDVLPAPRLGSNFPKPVDRPL